MKFGTILKYGFLVTLLLAYPRIGATVLVAYAGYRVVRKLAVYVRSL